jgi:DNA (cytosine-5)-methyltransferase 1
VGEPMSHVDLCSGIGGFALGFEWAGLSKPVLFCDIEPWSRKVLAKHWPDVPIADDVKELASDPDRFIPRTDPRNTILSSGYPCQPFSVAGKQRGTEDDRHLWPFISQIIAHKRPAFCVLENVYGHVALGLDEVLADLEAQDYAARAFIVPACAVNAPHRRDRIWIIARNVGNSEHDGSSAATVSGKHREDEAGCAERQIASKQSEGASEPGHDADVGNAAHNGRNSGAAQAQRERAAYQSGQSQSGLWGKFIGSGENVADTDSKRGRLRHTEWQDAENVRQSPRGQEHRGWNTEPAMGRVAHGIPGRVDRLKGLGNAIVPQIAMQIGLTIKAVRDA